MNNIEFRKYMSSNFASDVTQVLVCNNSKYKEYIKSYEGLYEGTIRAAAWHVLRNRLPDSWFVQAECEYPEKDTVDRADIVVWSIDQIPFVIEVKPFIGMDKILDDIEKLNRYLKRNIHENRYSYLIYLTIYGIWELEVYPHKNSRTCTYCSDKYKEIGKCMPFGYGDCRKCIFAQQTVRHLNRKNIEVIPLYIPAS
jgi:hypothetical protein